MAEEPTGGVIERMSAWQRLEHGLLALCVLLLVATGLARHYHLSGPDGTLLLHRWAAVGLIAAGVFHLAGLALSRSHQRDFRGLAFRRGDLGQALRGASYELTGKGEPPRYGRFTPMQKLQYWGIVAGCALMALSGLLLWSGPGTLGFMPLWARNLVLVLHSNQAQLIFVVLILWHLYDVHVAGGNFPMNPCWLTGKMPADAYRRQHRSEDEGMAP
jgi:cytochrome b subunit of formate dehydrogenase